MEKFLIEHEIWIKALTLITAVIIGLLQISINNRLKNLQDFVAVAITPGPEGTIKIMNTGKVNLYLCGFDSPGNVQRLKRSRLLSVGTGDSSYYWISPPKNTKEGEEFTIVLYLEDQFKQKWISEHGGVLEQYTLKKEGKEEKALAFRVWSYRTYKNNWSFKNK